MRKIKIERLAGHYGKFRKLKLFIDDQEVGSLSQGDAIELELPDNADVLYGKMDWGKTKPLSLKDVKENDFITFKPYFTFNLFRNLAILSLPIKVSVQ